MKIVIVLNDKGNPPGKIADAELLFDDGPLAGLKLIGFGIWESRGPRPRSVTFPARQYSVNGERRSFALLRPQADVADQDRLRDQILAACAKHEAETTPHSFVADKQDATRVYYGQEDIAHCATCGQAEDRPIHREATR